MGVCYEESNIKVFNDDFLWANIDEEVNLIVTSPPYNLSKGYLTYDDSRDYDRYINELIHPFLSKAYDIVLDDGRLCLNIPVETHLNGLYPTYVDIMHVAIHDIGWKYKNTISWYKQNVSKRTAWGSWMSASAPNLLPPFEMIGVLYKKQWKRSERGESNVTKQEFIDWTISMWSFPGQPVSKVGGHPAPFPVELPFRCIKLFSYVGDTVLDPFMGSGSTLVACKTTGRRGIGVDIDEEYCRFASERIANTKVRE